MISLMISFHVQERIICNFGIASSTGICRRIRKSIKINSRNIRRIEKSIKISGCMNACGQHNMSQLVSRNVNQWKISSLALQVLVVEF
jgi:sulfite reductase (ferredoxin)